MGSIQGGISIYLLIGFVWALFYSVIATLDANAFSQPLVLKNAYFKALNFSFMTLTTLDFSDIVPTSEIALMLSNLEAIIGQLYTMVFAVLLVVGYLSWRSTGEGTD